MTPAARVQAGIELWQAVDDAPEAPADAIANAWFRARRFIGATDRRVMSDRLWTMLRAAPRLVWHLKRARAPITPRTLMLAQLVIVEGTAADAVAGLFNAARHGPAPLADSERRALAAFAGRTPDEAAMPEAARLGVPDWLLPRLAARFGARLSSEMAAFDAAAPTDLRANLLKTTREQVRAALAAEGIATEPTPFSPWGLRAQARPPVTATRAFREGLVEIQDEGSQLIAAMVDARPGMRVCDFCAGAAGKTLALAAAMGNRGQIVAADVSAARLEAAVKRLRRAGVSNVERRLIEPGAKWLKRGAGGFDRVLVDAPCTGTGTWRRKPDARLRLAEADLLDLAQKQSVILERAAGLVKPGGVLVYATCSVLTEENEAQVESVLSRVPGFAVLPLAVVRARTGVTLPGDGPYLSLTPAGHGTDGFFAAALVREPAA
ncbi:RsmB/NOP family class I SAM-dependent RNA methyltransferase [Elioraea sp.]|uniref:RsmB/NOP family class I SAM-dependent RNA methyltransferase n=1 Tax=Elioraea sp. TaxID=2185103 RepID=UPI003F7009B9